ncbi:MULTISPECIES: response regulator [unclassified Synechocystis]|uniref:response regulator n=1 Tax=unclassified Synechocystis TaxID=2640012 RepID=UPI00048E53E8|nr:MULTISPECIES: response regulator [unclassified Synechocystis]AIE74393.1 PatA subfamily [Synechocystis sp. PCC 6714]MCT0254834.1 response regulator [Synechocystis sp. CS-94]
MSSSVLSLSSPSNSQIQQAIPAKLLYALVQQKASGKLVVQNPFDEFVYWQVYLGDGRIHLANSANGCTERLNYLIGGTLRQKGIELPSRIADDYLFLSDLWKRDIFSFQQTRSILTQATQEALVQVLSLPKASYRFNQEKELSELFLNLDLERTINPIKHKIRYWWELRSYINSPFQRPLVENWLTLRQNLAKNNLHGQHWLKRLHHCLENLNCLYEIASQLEISTLELALMFQPMVKTGEIKMLPYQEIQMDDRPLVAYVDHREAHQRMMGYSLEKAGYRTSVLDDPFRALTVLLNSPPNLIIINTDLPDMNGYQLCSFCRKSNQLKDVPILLLGKGDNLITNIRTKFCQASGYLNEPFTPQELLGRVEEMLPANKVGS